MNQHNPLNISPLDLHDLLKVDSSTKPIIVDVREENELAIAPFTFSVLHLPLSKFKSWNDQLGELLPIDKPIVVICHSGVRSLSFGVWLLEQGITQPVWNLEGGIDSWSINVDKSITRY